MSRAARAWPALLAAAVLTSLGGCASNYATATMTGGYSESQLGPDLWFVRYGGNGYTTEETVQSYWLHRCAELTLSKGYDGFRLVTPMTLTREDGAPGRPPILRVSTSDALSRYAETQKPSLTGQIKMLHKPFKAEPGHTFDAAALKAFLDPYVLGAKCGGNVCPHVHRYLYPPGV